MPRLTVASAVSTGHEVTVFSYQPAVLRRELPGIRVEDAREVLDDPALTEMNARIPDHFSDHFRVEGLAKGLGVWVDLDVVFLSPIGSPDYLLGADNGEICGAILKLPAGSAMLDDYLALCRHRPVRYLMPWWTWRKKAFMTWKRIEKKLRGKPPPRLQYGPPMLTYPTGKHQMQSAVARQDVYFPVPCSKGNVAAFGDGHRVEEFLTPNSRTVHLWSQYYQKVIGSDRPQRDTWLGRKCTELAI